VWHKAYHGNIGSLNHACVLLHTFFTKTHCGKQAGVTRARYDTKQTPQAETTPAHLFARSARRMFITTNTAQALGQPRGGPGSRSLQLLLLCVCVWRRSCCRLCAPGGGGPEGLAAAPPGGAAAPGHVAAKRHGTGPAGGLAPPWLAIWGCWRGRRSRGYCCCCCCCCSCRATCTALVLLLLLLLLPLLLCCCRRPYVL
jgi:hypothetical protein